MIDPTTPLDSENVGLGASVIRQLKADVLQLKEDLKVEIADSVLPVGFTYVQYPTQKTPFELGFPGIWTELDFNGAFFRASGGEAEGFERRLILMEQEDPDFGVEYGTPSTASVLQMSDRLPAGTPILHQGQIRFITSSDYGGAGACYGNLNEEFSPFDVSGDFYIGQRDAIRNIEGSFGFALLTSARSSGVFELRSDAGSLTSNSGSPRWREVGFNASLVVPTANENRPLNYTVRIWQRTA